MAYPPQEPYQHQQPGQYPGQGYPPSGGYPPQGPPPQTGKTGLIIVIVAAAVVLLGGGAAAGVWLLWPRSASDSGTAAAPQNNPDQEPAPADTPELAVPADMDGSWEGHIWQFDSEFNEMADFDVELELTTGTTTATAELWDGSSHMCSWDLELLESTGADHTFAVTATDREITCVQQSEVILTQVDSGLELYWTGTLSDGSDSSAAGTLTSTS